MIDSWGKEKRFASPYNQSVFLIGLQNKIVNSGVKIRCRWRSVLRIGSEWTVLLGFIFEDGMHAGRYMDTLMAPTWKCWVKNNIFVNFIPMHSYSFGTFPRFNDYSIQDQKNACHFQRNCPPPRPPPSIGPRPSPPAPAPLPPLACASISRRCREDGGGPPDTALL